LSGRFPRMAASGQGKDAVIHAVHKAKDISSYQDSALSGSLARMLGAKAR
jgi:hypothetical protein